MKHEIQIVSNADELARAAAAEFVERAARAVQTRGIFSVALSGGATPRSMYSLLASETSLRAQVPWEHIHFFWGDERHVPPDHADSNYRMACEAMLARVPVPAANIHRIKSEYADARSAADEYEADLRAFFKLPPHELPRFDLVLLGMGPDGHTASLFPGTDALGERADGCRQLGWEVQGLSHHDDFTGLEQCGLGDLLRERRGEGRSFARRTRRGAWPVPVAVDSPGRRKFALAGGRRGCEPLVNQPQTHKDE